MDVIFLTGAGSEPAQSIAGRLIASGFRVYGFDARFPAQGLSHADFFPVPVNLADASAVNAALAPILARETGVTGVVIAGNYPVPDTFEVTHEGDIPLALGAAVTAPMLLVRAVLPMLVRLHGHVVAITHAGTPAHGALSAACAGALQAFIRTLFEELRDTGVKAAHLRIEENATPDPAARYTQAPQSEVQPEIVADTIETLFRFRENNALTELVLRPQATREEPRIPVTHEPRLRAIQIVQLPPPKNLVPEELIPTPERKRPAYAPPPEENDGTDADEDDDDDNSVDPELLYLVRPKHQRPQPPQNTGAVDEDDDGTDDAPPQRQQQQRGQHDDRRRAPQGQQQQPQPPQRPDSTRIQLRGPTPRNPEAQARRQQQQQQQQPPPPPPYPEGWHGPRVHTARQISRLLRRQRFRQHPLSPRPAPAVAPQRMNAPTAPTPPVPPTAPTPPTAPVPPPPVREFVPPPPRESPVSDLPIFKPPAAPSAPRGRKAPTPPANTTPPPAKKSASVPSPKSSPRPTGQAKKRPARPRKTAPKSDGTDA